MVKYFNPRIEMLKWYFPRSIQATFSPLCSQQRVDRGREENPSPTAGKEEGSSTPPRRHDRAVYYLKSSIIFKNSYLFLNNNGIR